MQGNRFFRSSEGSGFPVPEQAAKEPDDVVPERPFRLRLGDRDGDGSARHFLHRHHAKRQRLVPDVLQIVAVPIGAFQLGVFWFSRET